MKHNYLNTYKNSHMKEGYGDTYLKTYQKGYYYYQWVYLEIPILDNIFINAKYFGAKKYLDFACGTGRIINLAEKYFEDLLGIDLSETMLRHARETCIQSRFLNIDISKNKIKEKFDVITAFRFFLNAEEEIRKTVLTEFYNMLNSEGILVINIHVNRDSFLGYYYRMRNKLVGKNIANTLGFNEFKLLIEAHGFFIETYYWYSYLPRVGWHMEWLSKYFMKEIDKIWKKIYFLPKNKAQSFIVVCKKKESYQKQ